MSKKKYPRELITKFEFQSTIGIGEIIRVVNNCWGGVLFNGLFSISFEDWDKLVAWVEKRRFDKQQPQQGGEGEGL